MIRNLLLCLTFACLCCSVGAFSPRPLVKLSTASSSLVVVVHSSTGKSDDYDSWYNDFDPSSFQHEPSTFNRGDRSGGGRSGSERSGGGRFGAERSSGGGRSGGDRSGGGRFGGDRSGGDRSGGGRFGGDRSGGGRFGGERSGGGRSYRGGGGERGGNDYIRDIDADNSNVNVEAVNALISERLQCRKTGRFDEADAIRDKLLEEHGVRVFDKENMWRSGCSASGSGSKWGRSNNGGPKQRRSSQPRSFGPNGHDYELSSDAGPNVSGLSDDEIHARIAERLQCKMSRNFRDADAIQVDLERSGVFLQDGIKEWRADGEPFGDYLVGKRGPGRNADSRSDRNRPYTKSPESKPTDFETQIQVLVDDRCEAKRARNFDAADDIRDDLRELYNVEVNDKLRMWSVGGDFGSAMNGNRAPGPFQMASWSEVPENADYIQGLVEQRDTARGERDFDTADEIRDELTSLGVEVNDKRREWSVGRQASSSSDEPKPYVQRGGGGDLSPEDVVKITKMLEDRDEAKRNRKFGKADGIRDHLQENYMIRVDDRSREWHVVTNDYSMLSDGPISEETKELIQEKVKERSMAKLQKDYETADAIRDELAQEYNVVIDDRLREWRIEGAINTVDEWDADEDDDDFASLEGMEATESDVIALEQELEHSLNGNVDDLASLKVEELKERLRAAGLPVSGKKSELIERLSNN